MKDLKTLFPKASNAFLQANEKALIAIAPDITPDTPKLRRPKAMNATEREFSLLLEAQRRKGEIVSWQFEGITLRLADGCKYTPDFLIVVSPSPLRIRICEVKGRHIWDDSKVKWRVAKDRYPWADWQLWQRADGRWSQIA